MPKGIFKQNMSFETAALIEVDDGIYAICIVHNAVVLSKLERTVENRRTISGGWRNERIVWMGLVR